MPHGGEVLQSGDDFVLVHDRHRIADCGEPFGIIEVHAFWALQVQEMAQRLFTERQEGQAHRARVVPGRLGQVGPRQMRRRAKSGQHVRRQGEVQHLLGGHPQNGGPPALDGL